MFEFIRSVVFPATETKPAEFSILAKSNEGKLFSFFKQYSENGIVADEEGNIFTEGEIFEGVKNLITEPVSEKPKAVKKKTTTKAKKLLLSRIQ